MISWPATKARRVLDALLRIGWSIKRMRGGSHKVLQRTGFPDYIFSFHDSDEIGPKMLSRIAKHTGLTPNDL
jgi:predicted RNA binding protein YcfA (HicA-like mRNA interferase family)